MLVCPSCASLGERIDSVAEPRRLHHSEKLSAKKLSGTPQIPSPYYGNSEERDELVEDYNVVLRQARERLGITQEELGNKVNEKPSTIRLVERGSLRPSDSLTRKLEHYLKIELLAPIVDED